MSKQDRNGVRTAADLERKYDLALVGMKKAVKVSEEGINKINAELESFMKSALHDFEELQAEVDGKIATYFYSGVPALDNSPANEWAEADYGKHVGDLYYDEDTGKSYRFSQQGDVFTWLPITDSDVTEALEAASKAQDTADNKRRVFTVRPFPPYDEGDLWLHEEELYVCQVTKTEGAFASSDFEIATKYTDDTALNQFVDIVYAEAMKNLTNQIDSKITTWYYTGAPTLSNLPASEWTTAEEKLKHTGDLYYDRGSGKTYIFEQENGVYAWELIEDNAIAEAMALANAAGDTADSKRRVFVAQPAPPYDNGDLWFNDQEIYICQVSKADNEVYADKDFIIATKYTDDTVANQVGENLEVVRGTVTTIQESVDAFKIEIETTVKTVNDLQEETIESLERMSYTFGTNDLTIANSNDPVNARINNQGLKVYTYNTLQSIFNHKGTGIQKLIVVGDAQLGNLSFVKTTDENGNACTDINYLISNVQTLADLE